MKFSDKKLVYKRNLKERLYILQRGRCHYCKRECRMQVHLAPNEKKGSTPLDLFTVDHIFPASKGGRLTEGNAFGSCYQCNQQKGDKLSVRESVPINPVGSVCVGEEKFKPEVKLDLWVQRTLIQLRKDLYEETR
jgi:hypothetical protein